MSIGKSSLERAAAATAAKPAAVKPAVPEQTWVYEQTAVGSITAARGDTLPETAPSELVASVRRQGILEPLTAARTPRGELLLLSGGYRLSAAREAGLETVPVFITAMDAAAAAKARREIRQIRQSRPAADNVRTVVADTLPRTERTELGQEMPDWLL